AQEQSAAYYAAEKLMAAPDVALDERIKQTEAAMEAFLKANPNAKLAPAAYGYLARFAFERKDYAKAEDALQKALAHPQTDAVQRAIVLLSLGAVKAAQGKPADGVPFIGQIADKRFEDAKGYALGTANLAAGKPEDARRQFQQAVTAQPNSSVSTWAKDALDYLP
ncbi:MAG TPA: tetratricopeptide repeat protein, partial [bacterium]